MVRLHITPRALAADARRTCLRGWSETLLASLGVRVVIEGTACRGGTLIVANHVSWLDVPAIAAVVDARFVSKHEVGRWPVAGRIARAFGTLMLHRGRLRELVTVNHAIAAQLAAGNPVALFPEGTTTDGSALLPFRGALLEPAARTRRLVQPVALRYAQAAGADAAAFTGRTTLVASLWRVVCAEGLTLTVHLLPPIEPGGLHRREIAALAHSRIAACLAVPHVAAEASRSLGPQTAGARA